MIVTTPTHSNDFDCVVIQIHRDLLKNLVSPTLKCNEKGGKMKRNENDAHPKQRMKNVPTHTHQNERSKGKRSEIIKLYKKRHTTKGNRKKNTSSESEHGKTRKGRCETVIVFMSKLKRARDIFKNAERFEMR